MHDNQSYPLERGGGSVNAWIGGHSNDGITSASLELDLVALEVRLVLDYFDERLQRLENAMVTLHTLNSSLRYKRATDTNIRYCSNNCTYSPCCWRLIPPVKDGFFHYPTLQEEDHVGREL